MGTSPTSRSRRPAGTPTGGQFAPEAHAEPEVTIGADAAPPGRPSESRREVASNGTVQWYDADGKLHRDAAPAIEYADGSRWWYQHGELHRDGAPAIEWADGTKEWYQHGQIHRDGGPAVEQPDGYRAWYQHGERHRDGGPAVERTEFWVHGERVAPPVGDVLDEPLTRDQILERMDDQGFITGKVRLDLDELVDGDLESTLDTMSWRLVGSPLLMNVDYAVVGVDDGSVVFRVTGDPQGVLGD